MKQSLLLFIAVLSLIGIADAGYISYEKSQHLFPVCGSLFKCSDVLSSKWASIGPIPISFLGLVFYICILVLASLIYLQISEIRVKNMKVSLSNILLGLSFWGILFSAYLVTVMAAILKAWCLYCLISAGNCLVIWFLTITFFWLNKTEKEHVHES